MQRLRNRLLRNVLSDAVGGTWRPSANKRVKGGGC